MKPPEEKKIFKVLGIRLAHPSEDRVMNRPGGISVHVRAG